MKVDLSNSPAHLEATKLRLQAVYSDINWAGFSRQNK